jgi:hypothetical protein
VSFPAAETIGRYAFWNCTGLTEVSFPEVTSIRIGAFDYCAGLKTVSFLKVETIEQHAFGSCRGLKTVSFPKVETIEQNAFSGCTGLTTLSETDFPKVTSIGYAAFLHTGLETVSFPKVTSIGGSAFGGCTSLTSVSFPAAETIGESAFWDTRGTVLAITLGSKPPAVGYNMFYEVTESKTVTVSVPSGASGSYNTAWQEAFKGVGNDGGSTGEVNSYITLEIEEQEVDG